MSECCQSFTLTQKMSRGVLHLLQLGLSVSPVMKKYLLGVIFSRKTSNFSEARRAFRVA
jgi:hypothetical protein